MQDARILIMDDEAQERDRIRTFLLQKGYDAM
jgi:DNA-binding response OmpR family regulator